LPKDYEGKSNLFAIRGGSFSTVAKFATTTYRIGWPARGGETYKEIGFRCAKDAPQELSK